MSDEGKMKKAKELEWKGEGEEKRGSKRKTEEKEEKREKP